MTYVLMRAAIRYLLAGGTEIVITFVLRSLFLAVLMVAGLLIGFLAGGPIGALLSAVLLAVVGSWVLIEWDELAKVRR